MQSETLPIKVLIGSQQRDLALELSIDQANLAGELSGQASWYAYYANLMVDAGGEYDQVKSELENLEANVANTIRANAIKSSEKITEKRIELELMGNTTIQAKKRFVLEKKTQYEKLKIIVRAFEQRLQALISMSALERVQMKAFDSASSVGPVPSHQPQHEGFINVKNITTKQAMIEEIQQIRNRQKINE